jgi:uncharacterized DUF497 family protein
MMRPDLEFEWDDEKAASNLKKHGVSFEEAETVFDDPYARVIDDPDHSDDESRAILIGYAANNQMLFVSYAARGERIRFISARRATREERKTYEQTYN